MLLSQTLLLVGLPPIVLYSARLYLFSLVALWKRRKPSEATETRGPLVSVIIPLFNKAGVVDRLMTKVTAFRGPPFEVIVADDSHDSSPEKLEIWRKDPRVTAVYRPTRRGWKAGALNEALKEVSRESEFCLFLDADSLPEPDLLEKMVSRMEETGSDVVQGAQQPDANVSMNWVSRGLSLVLDGYNFVDLQARKELGLLIPVTGSNFMVRTELIKSNPFMEGSSEDWELTAELWSKGWKVTYAPDIVVKGESPDRIRGVLHRYALWAESTTADTVNNAGAIAGSRNIRRRAKVDFFLSGFSYLMSIFVILAVVGLILVPVPVFGPGSTAILQACTAMAIFVLPAGPISLVVSAYVSRTNGKAFSVIMGLVGSILVVPVVAYASLKGLVKHGRPVEAKAKGDWVDTGDVEAEAYEAS